MSMTQQQVISLLENVLFESDTQAAANAATWQANSAAADISGLAAAMAASGEEKIAATIVGYYISALGRAPTAAEVRFYVAVAEQGLTRSQIAAGQVSGGTWDQISQYFSHSPEFAARGGLDSNIGLDQTGLALQAVPWLYESVLGRAPSGAEIAYYDNLVVNGTNLGMLFRYFTSSGEFHADTDAQIANALANYGASVTDGGHPAVVGSGVTVGTPPAPPVSSPTPSRSFGVLSAGADTIDDSALTGANTYQATLGTGATLNSHDSLIGNGLATLAITDNGTGGYVLMPTAPLTLSGIQTVTLTTAEDVGTTGGTDFDLSGVAGLSAFNLTAGGTGLDVISIASGVAVTASAHSSQFVLVASGTGNSLNLTDPNLSTLGVTGGFTGNIGSVTLTSTGGPTSLTLDLLGISSLHFTDNNHLHSLFIEALSGTNSISAISDTALTDLSVGTNSAVDFGTSSAYLALPDGLTSLDTSGDYFGNAYVDIGGATVTATFGAGTSFITGGVGSAITLNGNAHSTGAVTVNGFDALTIAAHSYSSVTLEGTGASVDITDTSMTSLAVNGLTLTGTLTAGSASLTIAGTGTASAIAAISDAGLTSLAVSAGKVAFGSSGAPIGLGTSVATVDLSGDTDTAGTNYFTVNSNNIAITTGTDSNVIDLNNKTGAVITPGLEAVYNSGSPAPNLILDNVVSGTKIAAPNIVELSATNVTQLSDLIATATAEFASNSQPVVIYSDLGGSDLYLVEATSATAGNGNLSIIKIVGGGAFASTLSQTGSGAGLEILL